MISQALFLSWALLKIRLRIKSFFAGARFKMELRRADAAGIADSRDNCSFGYFLSFVHFECIIVCISRDPAVRVFDKN